MRIPPLTRSARFSNSVSTDRAADPSRQPVETLRTIPPPSRGFAVVSAPARGGVRELKAGQRYGWAGAAQGVEIILGPGRTVRVPAGFDRQTLAEVLAVLEARPC